MIFTVVTQLQETHNRGEQLDTLVKHIANLEEICQRAEQAAKQSRDCGFDRPIHEVTGWREPNDQTCHKPMNNTDSRFNPNNHSEN